MFLPYFNTKRCHYAGVRVLFSLLSPEHQEFVVWCPVCVYIHTYTCPWGLPLSGGAEQALHFYTPAFMQDVL